MSIFQLGKSYPDRLYKYCAITDYRIESIETNKIFLSHPTSFNDPWDLQLSIRPLKRRHVNEKLLEKVAEIGVSRFEFKDGKLNEIDGKVRDYGPSIMEATINHDGLHRFMFENTGVYSLSETASSPLMWSYYADGHAGMVISYRVGKRAAELEDDLRVRKVRYQKRYPKLSKREFLMNFDSIWEPMVTTKGMAWSHEKEWRILSRFGGDLVPCPFPIEFIAFGLKAPVKNKLRVFDACCARMIRCYQAIRHPTKYFSIYLPVQKRSTLEKMTPEVVQEFTDNLFYGKSVQVEIATRNAAP